MADVIERAVVDAGVLIAFLNADEDGHARSRELLADAEEGRVELWAPAVLLVEVSRWSRDGDPADPDDRDKLEDFLEQPWLKIMEIDRRLARVARDVVATTAVRTGVDALYIATAKLLGITTVYSWDSRLLSVDYLGVQGREPPGSREPRLDLDSD